MGKRYDLIVFDWDGTVMDSTAVIAASIQAACRDLGLAIPGDETARHAKHDLHPMAAVLPRRL